MSYSEENSVENFIFKLQKKLLEQNVHVITVSYVTHGGSLMNKKENIYTTSS